MSTLKKVLVWRAISVVITMIITYAWSGSIKHATGLTIALQGALFLSHWVFESWCLNQNVQKLLGPRKKRPDGLDEEGWDHNDWRPGR